MTHKRNIQTFYFNSEFAVKKGQNHFSQKIHIDKRVNHIEIVQYSIPKSFYIIRQQINNIIRWRYEDVGLEIDTSGLFALDEGNYTRTQLEAALLANLNAIGYGLTFTVSHRTDLENGKIVITCTAGVNNSKFFTLLFDKDDSPWQILNADNTEDGGTIYKFSNAIASYALGPINLQEATNIYCCTQQLRGSTNISKNNQQMNNVLYSFSLQNTPQFNYASMPYHYDDHKKLFRELETEVFELQLYFIDDLMRPVDFQDIPFSLSIQFFYVEHDEAVLQELHALEKRVAVLSQFLFKRFAEPQDQLFLQQLIKEEASITQSELA